MSVDKYPSIISQMEAIVFVILEIFFATHGSFKNWGIFKYNFRAEQRVSSNLIGRAVPYRGDPFNQNFRKFRSKTEWIGKVQPEKFRRKRSTFRSGPLLSVGPVRSK